MIFDREADRSVLARGKRPFGPGEGEVITGIGMSAIWLLKTRASFLKQLPAPKREGSVTPYDSPPLRGGGSDSL